MSVMLPILSFGFALALDTPQDNAEWFEYRQPTGLFVVKFPTKPRSENMPGGAPQFVTTADGKNPNLVFTVKDTLPLGMTPQQTQGLVDEFEKGIVSKEGGKLLGVRPITVGNHVGKEVRVSLPSGGISRMRAFALERHVVILMATSGDPEEDLDSAEAVGFFDSFQPFPSAQAEPTEKSDSGKETSKQSPGSAGGPDRESLPYHFGYYFGLFLPVLVIILLLLRKKRAKPPTEGLPPRE
jgi:hypothetical protein